MRRAALAPGTTAVLVPIKAFHDAKVRLAPALPAPARADLARRMAALVVAAAAPLPVSVVCDDDDVALWAEAHGAAVVWAPGAGLNGAVAAGVASLGSRGAATVIVSHADLPLAADLAWVGRFPGVTIVPDRHERGTNVIAVPAAAGFRFSYGPASFARHLDEARRLGIGVRIARVPALAWDVDLPADLAAVPAAP